MHTLSDVPAVTTCAGYSAFVNPIATGAFGIVPLMQFPSHFVGAELMSAPMSIVFPPGTQSMQVMIANPPSMSVPVGLSNRGFEPLEYDVASDGSIIATLSSSS